MQKCRMAKRRGKDGRKTYTMEFKLAVLQKLREHNGNYYRTAKETGIPNSTLKRWEERFGGELIAKENIAEAVDDLVAIQRDVKRRIMPKYYEAIEAGVQRVVELIPYSMSIDDLRKAIQTFSDLAGLTPEGAEGNESTGDTFNLYNIVNQQLQKTQGDEKNTITIQGDPEEHPDK